MPKISVLLYRRPDLSFEDFDRHWREVHGPMVVANNDVLRLSRYVQTPRPRDPLDTWLLASHGVTDATSGPDGLAELHWASRADLDLSFRDPQAKAVWRDLVADERNFLADARMVLWLAEERVLI